MEYLNYSKIDGVAHIEINRPKAMNALNSQLLKDLDSLLDSIRDDSDVQAVSLVGTGEKAFAAGADIKEFRNIDAQEGTELSNFGASVFTKIEQFSKPVIAGIQGYALGGGLELAMACHIRVCNKSARFGMPEINLGLLPGYSGTTRLPELVGRSQALHMMLTGDMIDADTALNQGLVSKVYADEKFDSKYDSLLTKLANKAPLAASAIIRCVQSYPNQRNKRIALESDVFGKLMETEDLREGISAFIEKRKANFKGK